MDQHPKHEHPTSAHTQTLLPNGNVLVAAGSDNTEPYPGGHNRAVLYDYITRTFTNTGS